MRSAYPSPLTSPALADGVRRNRPPIRTDQLDRLLRRRYPRGAAHVDVRAADLVATDDDVGVAVAVQVERRAPGRVHRRGAGADVELPGRGRRRAGEPSGAAEDVPEDDAGRQVDGRCADGAGRVEGNDRVGASAVVADLDVGAVGAVGQHPVQERPARGDGRGRERGDEARRGDLGEIRTGVDDGVGGGVGGRIRWRVVGSIGCVDHRHVGDGCAVRNGCAVRRRGGIACR